MAFCVVCNTFVDSIPEHDCKGKGFEVRELVAPHIHSDAVPTRGQSVL